MKKKLSMVLAVVLTLTLLLTGLALAGGGENEVVPAQMVLDASLSEVSIAFDTPKANLEVAGSREFSFGANKFLLSSIIDKNSKQAYMVSTDEQGKVWIAEPKIEGELVDHMSQMKPNETVTVSIWTIYVSPEEELWQIPSKYPDVPFEGYRPALEANVSPEVLDAIEADITEIKLKANEEAVQPVVDFLQSMGSTILYVSKYAPTVDAELSKGDVYKLARVAEVESISLPEEIEPCMNQAYWNINADDVWQEGYDGGMSDGSGSPTGTQTKVAVVDLGVDFGHLSLDHANGGTFEDKTASGDHGTAVAGCIASNDDDYTGIAPGTKILDANYYHWWPPSRWSEMKQATDWAITAGADVINVSSGWPKDGECDNDCCKYFDHIAFEHNRLTVCSAGNKRYTDEYCNVQHYVESPANAYNVLAVGGIEDKGDLNWANDEIYWMWHETCPGPGGCCYAPHLGYTVEGSSGGNPISPKRPGDYYLPLINDRHKPEVCAPAVDIMTALAGTDNDFGEWTGTSFSAPQVSGIAALLIEQNPSLKSKPALLKAIIMASAIHNVVPNNPYDPDDPADPADPFDRNKRAGYPQDDYEGVGTVDAYAAYECVNNNWIWNGNKAEANLPFEITFFANAGETVRFVITWEAHTDYHGTGYYELCADLGLEIKGLYWSSLGLSNSVDSAWEIVQFTAPYTGNYRARVTAYNHGYGDPWTFNGEEYIAAAWYCW